MITGCACDVTGWVSWISRSNCMGCQMQYNYSWTCTGPANSGDTNGTQTQQVSCNSSIDINIDSCLCDGTSLVNIGGECGICPEGS